MRYWLVELPARIIDKIWLYYWACIAALTILCFVNVALTLLLYWLGFPI